MDERPVSPVLKCLAALAFVFLLAPVLIVVPLSFSGDAFMSFPPSSWSLRWYVGIIHQPRILGAFTTSVLLALSTVIVSLSFGLPAAYALVRLRIPGREILANLFTAPLLLPSIVLAIAILIVFARFGWLGTFHGLLAAHVVVTLPYAVRVLSTALGNLPVACEEAAATLGASPLAVFRRVTLPLILPGVAATAALCFLVSFDETVLSLLLTGPRLTTLPVAMFHYVETRADPLVAAVSVILVAITLLIVLAVDRTAGLARTSAR